MMIRRAVLILLGVVWLGAARALPAGQDRSVGSDSLGPQGRYASGFVTRDPGLGRGSEKGGSGSKEQKIRRVEGEKVSVEEDKTVRPSDLLNFSPSGPDLGIPIAKHRARKGRCAPGLLRFHAFTLPPFHPSAPDLPFSNPARAASLSREELYAFLNEANTAFQQANAASDPSAGRQLYDKAILVYEKIINQAGVRNAGLYYNLANAYLLRDDLGEAILNYRRAERLDRSDLNIKKNLAFARSRRIDRVETAAPKRVLETLFFWHYDLSLPMKLLLACLAFAVACLAGTVMIWRGRGTAGLAVAVLSAVLALSVLVSILVDTRRQSGERFGVITAAEVVARQGDGPNYPPSFKSSLHAGTEFDLLEQRPGWLHIRLSDGADAWVPQDTAELG